MTVEELQLLMSQSLAMYQIAKSSGIDEEGSLRVYLKWKSKWIVLTGQPVN